ncbi:hypothetical protein CDD81_7083 [Ophiocordyceps australis]|uniref:Uncharacterized protein n=1 Tax=Ophiocordyceps australis TaxID=1399860 RepID=A0A2C5Y503_9HYPO|nr:hypothetical protein CDD81_7083 [Ophiocordyceps australis]
MTTILETPGRIHGIYSRDQDRGSLGASGVEAGASGDSSSAMTISTGGIIAIVVVVIGVTLIGVTTATLFFMAKRREWKVREKMRKSARKIVTALTPRRAEFPASAKKTRSTPGWNSTKIPHEVPPTPSFMHRDVEKAAGKNHATSVAVD